MLKKPFDKLIVILIFLISLELFFLFNGFTSTAFWYKLGRFGLSYKSTFLLSFGILSWILFFIALISAAYIIHKKILGIKSFSILTVLAFYLGGFGFWLAGFIPAFENREGIVSIICSPFSSNCLGLPANLFALFVYLNIIMGLVLIAVFLRKKIG